jgi:hypothetical protein
MGETEEAAIEKAPGGKPRHSFETVRFHLVQWLNSSQDIVVGQLVYDPLSQEEEENYKGEPEEAALEESPSGKPRHLLEVVRFQLVRWLSSSHAVVVGKLYDPLAQEEENPTSGDTYMGETEELLAA